MRIGPGVLVGDRALASAAEVLVGRTPQDRRAADTLDFVAGVQPGEELFIERNLYSLHVYNYTTSYIDKRPAYGASAAPTAAGKIVVTSPSSRSVTAG